MRIPLYYVVQRISFKLKMENRQYWTMEDTKALLCIWAEDNVQRQFDGVCRNEDIMKYIVAELAKLGIQRTTMQVREKLKKLRAQYKVVKTHNGQSGAQRRSFPWFDIMDGVLGHRPCVSGETTRDTMAATVVELECQSDFLESEVEQGPSTPPLLTSTPERHDGPQEISVIRGGSHRIPQRTRTESCKRKATNIASREFLQCMRDITQQQLEEERALRREEMNRDMMMRREELEYEAQLRREEMSQREKEADSFASVFKHLAAALQKK
ncbi:uncharacterized protein LOC113098817 [Carassius auratus]|uniref:Uncharacterized protein LOC113098817 n=1 Tax=Carassius auratus TaxID=7957 RepID=A0A6P6PE73_CARAU|nr:uncharacterized protein LOC113098817 [Carassius auratus]